MFRSIALITVTLFGFVSVGCSNDNGKQPNTGGNGGTGGAAGGGGSGGTGGTGGGGGGSGGTGGSGGGGSGGSGGMDMAHAGSPSDMGPMPDLYGLPAPDHDPTQHPPLPTMSSYNQHSTITAPEIYTVVWMGDETLGAKVNTFTTWMLASDYWKNGMKDYGVGAGTAKGVAVIQAAPPTSASDASIQNLIVKGIGDTAHGWPATTNANTIFSVVLDPKTSVPDNGGSCKAYDGYHSITQTTKSVPYLINAYCPDAMGNPDWDNLTVTISHEAGEASGDWNLQVNHVLDGTGSVYPGGGELGDMCLSLNASLMADASNTYLVQRLWSNSIAMANNADPCLPSTGAWFGPGLVSGGSDPSLVSVSLDASGKGTATFDINPFSFDTNFGPMGFYIAGSLFPAGVTLSPDIAIRTVNNMRVGSVIYGQPGSTNKITVNVDSTFQPTGGSIPLLVIGRDVLKTRYNIWWGAITVQ